jgi:phosphopantetheinyl transferase
MSPSQTPVLANPAFTKQLSALAATEIFMAEMDIEQLRNGAEADFCITWLNASEQIQFDRFSFEKRRLEWLAGRVSAKRAFVELYRHTRKEDISPDELVIEATMSGKPVLHTEKHKEVFKDVDFSISHSHDKAICLACRSRCGIDLQYLSNTLFKVKYRFCNDVETAMLFDIDADEIRHLGHLWSAKESIRKCLSVRSLLGFSEINLVRVTQHDAVYCLLFRLDKPIVGNGFISAVTTIVDNYSLAACVIGSDRLHA